MARACWSQRASNELETLLTRGIYIAFRKVKAHSSLRDRDATFNDRADRLAKQGLRLSRDDVPLDPLSPPASALTITISITSDIAQSTFSWGISIAQAPQDGGSEVLLHDAADFPILSPSHLCSSNALTPPRVPRSWRVSLPPQFGSILHVAPVGFLRTSRWGIEILDILPRTDFRKSGHRLTRWSLGSSAVLWSASC